MKNLRDNNGLAHAWAHQIYDSAQASNMSFRGAYLYSYAACIGKILNKDYVLYADRYWTPTTQRHQSLMRSATSHMKKVYCRDPFAGPEANMKEVRDQIGRVLATVKPPVMTKAGHEAVASVKDRDMKRSAALALAVQANDYAKAMTEVTGVKVKLINTEKLDDIRAEMARIERKVEKARKVEEERRAAEEQQELQRWRDHEPNFRGMFIHIAPALRMSKDGSRIETSRGAEIPVGHAKRLWPILKRVKARGWVTEVDSLAIKLGPYTLNSIKADGSIVVGCHTIAFSEIEGIAKALELV